MEKEMGKKQSERNNLLRLPVRLDWERKQRLLFDALLRCRYCGRMSLCVCRKEGGKK